MQFFIIVILALISPAYMFSPFLQLGSSELFLKESEFLIYGNGKDEPPTAFMFGNLQLKGLYFNQTPTKVFYSPSLFFFPLFIVSSGFFLLINVTWSTIFVFIS